MNNEVKNFVNHNHDSFDTFMNSQLHKIVNNAKVNVLKGENKGTKIQISFDERCSIEKPTMLPNEARLDGKTYSSKIKTKIHVKFEHNGIKNDEDETYDLELVDMPIMLHSSLCLLRDKTEDDLIQNGESNIERGGYFIIGGNEKVIVSQEDQKKNLIINSIKKLSDKTEYRSSIQSSIDDTRRPETLILYLDTKKNEIQVKIPYFTGEMPLIVLYRALGFENDKDILKSICGGFETEIANKIFEELKPSFLEANRIFDQNTALKWLSFYTDKKAKRNEPDQYTRSRLGKIYYLLRKYFLPHMNDETMNDSSYEYHLNLRRKGMFLSLMVRDILLVKIGLKEKTDREDLANKKVRLPGSIIIEMFRDFFEEFVKDTIKKRIDAYLEDNRVKNVKELIEIFKKEKEYFLDTSQFKENIMKSFRGKWGKNPSGKRNQGVLQDFGRHSFLESVSHLRRIHLPLDSGMWTFDLRRLHTSQFGYICSIEVPDGIKVGTSKHFAHTCVVSEEKDPSKIIEFIKARTYTHDISDDTIEKFNGHNHNVFVNSKWISITNDPEKLIKRLKELRHTTTTNDNDILDWQSSICWDIENTQININMNGGRFLRPIINCEKAKKDNHKFSELEKFSSSPEFLISKGCEYYDPEEIKNIVVKYDTTETGFKELTKTCQLGISALSLPFLEHNPLARNRYACSQVRSSVSLYASNYRKRYDQTASLIHYGQKPLTSTGFMKKLNNDSSPYGINLVVAIGCFNGFNQEDAVFFNKSAVERGMFSSSYISSYDLREEIQRFQKHGNVHIGNVSEMTDIKINSMNDYSKLDKNGIIKVGTVITSDTVLVGSYIETINGKKDNSLTCKAHEGDMVTKVYLSNTEPRIARITTMQNRFPICGDKFASRQAQKATIGILLENEEMPHTEDGIVPDILFNPHSFPSRMTLAYFYELLVGRIGLKFGFIPEVSPFNAIDDIQGKMEKILGDERYSEETLYSGETGEIACENAAVGIVYYKRLKQQVEDKIYAVGRDVRVDETTKQAKGGRSSGGGLKIGLMERDALLAHGLSSFVKESYIEKGDGAYFEEESKFGKVSIQQPYGFNLFKKELCGVGLRVENVLKEN